MKFLCIVVMFTIYELSARSIKEEVLTHDYMRLKRSDIVNVTSSTIDMSTKSWIRPYIGYTGNRTGNEKNSERHDFVT